ncbi:MAG: SpoIIE family protein phosphatase [Bacteroidetes bacterium]|nr:SpoIIE family protein phosphatase [Bacteroidota bacterium]
MEAMKFYQQAADTYRDNDDLSGESHVFVNIAQLSNLMARDAATGLEKEAGYRRAVKYAERAMTVAAETGELPMVNLACAKLSTAWAGLGDYKKAWEYAVRQIETGDSLYNAEKIKAVQEMESRYQSEKKQLQIENLEKDKVLQETKIEAQASDMKRQRIMIYSFIVVLSVILIFSFLLYRMFLAKKKANIELALKNHQIMQQKEEIEAQRDQLATQNDEIRKQKDEIESHIELIEKQRDTVTKQRDQIEHINTEITDSIHYAKRIQGAILPRDAYARDLLKDYFVLFRPKDIVSGDFYWMTKIEGRTVVAAADCTGHGVPGAFMSMLGAAFLNEIVNKEYITHTGVILRRLRKEIIKALQQKGQTGEQKDGMDISLCSIDMESLDFQFSGANNPLYIIRDKNAPELSGWEGFEGDSCILYEIKGDKMPIAIYERMDKFVDHELQLVKGDRLYLFTDGFADQFGGPKGKKFKYKPFKQLLLDNALNPMQEQKAVLEKSLQEWIVCDGTEYEQVDDITVVGIEI